VSILYISQNGVTDHIGRSQVAPYVLGLAHQGHRIHMLSAEKRGQDALIDQYQKLFDDVGVTWTRVRYHNRPPILGQAWTQAAMHRAARAIVRHDDIELIHCRSFPPALIGYRLKRELGVKYIFDFRDFYADGGLEKAHGLAKLAYRYFKHLEGPMIREADKVVCLTNRAREVLSDWYLRDVSNPASRFQVIPCCADFAHFDTQLVTEAQLQAARQKADLNKDDFVLLYLGSLGPDYLLPEMMALFRQVLAIKPGARFLFVSNNGRELVEKACAEQGVSSAHIRFVSADRSEIPALISLANLSVIFIRPAQSKIGCSPTKLAELFACNVPVIANTGVGDLDAIISQQKNGSVIVKDFADTTLRAAVERVVETQGKYSLNIRDNSREFSLAEGVARYDAVYRELLAEPARL
jgi:glycosyltransferase involved in cell wall biosynthesis